VDVAAGLVGLTVELPCASDTTPLCNAPAAQTKPIVLGGSPSTRYVLALLLRGVVEQNTYVGAAEGTAVGTNRQLFTIGQGTPSSLYATYNLALSDPPQVFNLNSGNFGNLYVDAFSYTVRVQAVGGSTLTLSADPQDTAIVANQGESGDPLVVSGVIPPQPFDGQFVQLDVVSVTPSTP
jgi:hypothetical protein